MTTTAKTLGKFRKELIAEGFSVDEAFAIVHPFVAALASEDKVPTVDETKAAPGGPFDSESPVTSDNPRGANLATAYVNLVPKFNVSEFSKAAETIAKSMERFRSLGLI